MIKIVFSLLLACISLGALQADECCPDKTHGLYVGMLGGACSQHKLKNNSKWLSGVFGGIVSGYKFENNVRLEGEFLFTRFEKKYYDRSWYSYETSKRTVYEYSLLGNILYDIDLGTNWSPYFGVGCGYEYAYEKLSGDNDTIHDSYVFRYSHLTHHKFVWQGILGIAYHSDAYQIGLDYRRICVCNIWDNNLIALSVSRYF